MCKQLCLEVINNLLQIYSLLHYFKTILPDFCIPELIVGIIFKYQNSCQIFPCSSDIFKWNTNTLRNVRTQQKTNRLGKISKKYNKIRCFLQNGMLRHSLETLEGCNLLCHIVAPPPPSTPSFCFSLSYFATDMNI